MQDESASLNLELSQLEQKCDNLQTDNAELLSRWIEAKQEMADAVNEMNDLATHNKVARPEAQMKDVTIQGQGEDGAMEEGTGDGGAPPASAGAEQ